MMSRRLDLNRNPFMVIWEATRACSLACRHCRAAAQPRKHPMELDRDAAFDLIDQVVRAEPMLFVITGGDPMCRADLTGLIDYATLNGLRVGLSPSATPRLMRADFRELRHAGVKRMSLSLDGACRESHDRFRGVRGVWKWTMEALKKAREAEIDVQINTTITRRNLGEFDDFVRLMDTLRPKVWSLFQLVPTGRGRIDDLPTGVQLEHLFRRLYELSLVAPYEIKTTEGMHYRRVALQMGAGRGGDDRHRTLGINDGKGFVFVSHIGEICPSGFFPVAAGNVKVHELIDVYRQSPLFRRLRDPRLLHGKCGYCEYNEICGGSRARAYAMTGDYLAPEPLCIYQPHAPAQPAQPVTDA